MDGACRRSTEHFKRKKTRGTQSSDNLRQGSDMSEVRRLEKLKLFALERIASHQMSTYSTNRAKRGSAILPCVGQQRHGIRLSRGFGVSGLVICWAVFQAR